MLNNGKLIPKEAYVNNIGGIYYEVICVIASYLNRSHIL